MEDNKGMKRIRKEAYLQRRGHYQRREVVAKRVYIAKPRFVFVEVLDKGEAAGIPRRQKRSHLHERKSPHMSIAASSRT